MTVKELQTLIEKAKDQFGVTEDSQIYIDVYECLTIEVGHKQIVIDINTDERVFERTR